MNPHCRGCVYHHDAGHPKGAAASKLQHNDWCCHYGRHAPKIVGHCKLKGGKKSNVPAKPDAASLH